MTEDNTPTLQPLSARDFPRYILDIFSSLGFHLFYFACFIGFLLYEGSVGSVVLLGLAVVLYCLLMRVHKKMRLAFNEYAADVAANLKSGAQPFIPVVDTSKNMPAFVHYAVTGQFDQALPLLKEAVDTEDEIAMYLLGLMYYQGQGVPKNDDLARLLLEKSAEHGYVHALVLMGVAYRDGILVKPDLVKARSFLTEAIRQKDPTAVREFDALLARTGENVPRGIIH